MQELSTAELKIREQADQYLRVQENTEYLTHLIRYCTNRKRVYLRLEVHLPQLRSIAHLIVQLSYLLFTCYVKKVNVLICQRFLLTHPHRRQPNPQVCCQYIMEKDYLNLRPQEQAIIDNLYMRHEFASQQMSTYGKSAINYLKVMLDMAKPQFDRLKTQADKLLCRQFINLQTIKSFLEARLHTIQHPRIVILCLQESQIFRQYSILVKVMNNSIFSTIKNSKHKNIFAEICLLDNNLKAKQNKKQHIQDFSGEIQSAIESLLKFLIKVEIVTVDVSISNNEKVQGVKKHPQKPKDGPNIPEKHDFSRQFNPTNPNKQYMLGQVQNTSFQQRLYRCRIQITQKLFRQFNQKVYQSLRFEALNNYNSSQMQQQKPKLPQSSMKLGQNMAKNEFVIQFYQHKGLLVVKYITPIELNIENTDLVMFQSNHIAYHWSSVSIELIQKSANKLAKKKQRFLCLKTLTHISIEDRPLFKLLLMLDLVMLCAKISEPELKRIIKNQEDYMRIQDISLKVNHMINLFIRKIERYYKIISQEQSQHQD